MVLTLDRVANMVSVEGCGDAILPGCFFESLTGC